jgi:hypothetical protein
VLVALGAALVVSAVGTVVLAQSNQTITGCKNNKKGTLRIVSSPKDCKSKTETAISWNKTGPAGPQGEKGQGEKGDAGPAGPPGPAGGFMVIDAEGEEVGTVVDRTLVARPSGPYWVSFGVDPLGIYGTADHPLYNKDTYGVMYETADCSGTPYMEAWGVYREGQVAGTKLYYPADPLQVRTIQSSQAKGPGSNGECSSRQYGDYISGPVESVDIPDFTPPFTTVRDAPQP